MPGWKIEPAKRVDLPADIADGLWISIHHPKLLPFDATQKFIALAPAAGQKDGKQAAQGSVAGFDLEKGKEFATEIILDWNLPGADGAILPTPKNDETVWQRIPALPVLMAIFITVGEATKAIAPDPNSSNGSASS
jgi:hypothetical protein